MKKTQYEQTKEWRLKRQAEGWQYMSQLVPPQLLVELKKYMKEWRLNNPNAYNRIKW
jgi:hypothetical protein